MKPEKRKKLCFLYSVLLNIFLCLCLLVMAAHYGTFQSVFHKTPFGGGRTVSVTENDYWKMKVEGFEKTPDKEAEIVFLGDSITDYTEISDLLDVSAPILNRGIGGDTVEGALQRLYQVTELRPRKIFILLGINDIGDGVELSQSIERYGEILDNIRRDSPETEIFVQSVLPVNHALMPTNERNRRRTVRAIIAYNQELETLSAEKGVDYIDAFSQMADADGEMPEAFTYRDGVHLSHTGMAAWADCFRPYLEETP